MPNSKSKKIPFILKPIWWFGDFLTSIGRFHDGEVKPLKSAIIGYVLLSKILLSVPVTVAIMLSWSTILLVFFSFLRINIMIYTATRVVKSINKNIENKKKRARTRIWVIALFMIDIGLSWVSFSLLLKQTLDSFSLFS